MVSLVSSPSLPTNIRHVRSISLPCKSHPSTLQLEEELANLKMLEASLSSTTSVETMCGSLVQLKKIYTSFYELINLPHTQQALLDRKDDTLVDELLDRSMYLLDVCGSIKDAMEQVKEHIRNIQSALRRRKEHLKSDTSSLLKMKDAKRAILALKQLDNKIGGMALLDVDHYLSSLIRLMRDSSALSVSIFGSLMSSNFMFVSKRKITKWTIVSNLIRKPKKAGLDQSHVSNEALESHIEVIDECLECMTRTLIKARVSLLNIRSN